MTETLNEMGACEPSLKDHVSCFYGLLRDEHVRIRLDIKRTVSDGVTYFDSTSFPNDVAKAIVADRALSLAPQEAEIGNPAAPAVTAAVRKRALELPVDSLKRLAPISARNHRRDVIAFLAQHRHPAGREAKSEDTP